MNTDEEDGSVFFAFFTVNKLQTALVWQERVAGLVPAGIVVMFFSIPIGIAIIGIAACFFLVADAAFSIIVTIIFLHPIFNTLSLVSVAGRNQTLLVRKLQQSKYRNVVGCFIIVVSTSLVYVNFMLWAAVGNQFAARPYLNPFVFGLKFDSIVNDLSVSTLIKLLLVSFPSFLPQCLPS
jgi:hypothetical protein